jgi:hypothetical protein
MSDDEDEIYDDGNDDRKRLAQRNSVNRNIPTELGINVESLKLGLLGMIFIAAIVQLFQQRALIVAINASLERELAVVLSADQLDIVATRLESSMLRPGGVGMTARRCLEQYVDMSSAFATAATPFIAFAERHMNRSIQLQQIAVGLITDWSADTRVGATIAAEINQDLRKSVTTLQAGINDREAVLKQLASVIDRHHSRLQQVIDCVSFGP